MGEEHHMGENEIEYNSEDFSPNNTNVLPRLSQKRKRVNMIKQQSFEMALRLEDELGKKDSEINSKNLILCDICY